MRTPLPKPGTQVHLVLIEHSPVPNSKPTWVLDATVIDKFWWENDPKVFCVLVPGDEVPTRSIRMDDVVSINGDLVEGWDVPEGALVQRWHVESNSGPGAYEVTFDGSKWHCQCKGFAYYRHCRHIDQVKNAVH